MVTTSLKEDSFILKGEDSRYESAADAHMRLTRSVVRFENEPVYVLEVAPTLEMHTWDMRTSEKHRHDIKANDKRLDISSIPLGYVNYNGEGYYASRAPARAQKQGVSPISMCYDSMSREKRLGNGTLIQSDFLVEFGKMCRNEYIELPEALDISKNRYSAAFSKTWGVSKTKDGSLFTLYHRMNPVGIFIKSENLFLFQKDELNRVRERSLRNVLAKESGKYNVEAS